MYQPKNQADKRKAGHAFEGADGSTKGGEGSVGVGDEGD